MRSFINSCIAEMLKLKRSFALWLCLSGGSVITIVLFNAYFFKPGYFIPAQGANPWEGWISRNYQSLPALLLPFFVILLTALVTQVEHKSSTIKHIMSQPLPKGSFFFGKYIVILLFIVLTHVLFDMLIVLGGYLLGFSEPRLRFDLYDPDWFRLFRLTATSFYSILGIASIQYWISLRFKNFIIPVSFGMMALVVVIVIFGWEKTMYIPYSYAIRLSGLETADTAQAADELFKLRILNLAYFLLPLFLGFWQFRRMNIK
jgi:lantibiotic transport system permease protein